MNPSPDRRTVVRIASMLGCKIDWRKKHSTSYDKRVIYAKELAYHIMANVCHELAHFMLASPKRREHPDYGLGSGPDSSNKTMRRWLPAHECNAEEVLASLLGIALFAQIGATSMELEDILREHGWCVGNTLSFWECVGILNDSGYMEGRTVTFKMRREREKL